MAIRTKVKKEVVFEILDMAKAGKRNDEIIAKTHILKQQLFSIKAAARKMGIEIPRLKNKPYLRLILEEYKKKKKIGQ